MRSTIRTITTTIALLAFASTAVAGGNNNNNRNQETNQIQGQLQGQAQGQLSYNNNDNTNRNNNRNTNLSLSGAEAEARSSVSIRTEGSVNNSVGLAALAGGACTSGSVTAGAEGIGIGFSWSKNYCELIALGAAAEVYGGNGAAVLCSGSEIFRDTQPQLCTSQEAITTQDYGSKVDTVVATRTAPASLYSSCEVVGNTPHITIPAEYIGDAAYTQRAAEACFATR